MIAALVHECIVDRFVKAYVAEYERAGILGGPGRDRELAETIGREVLLASIVETHSVLPRIYGKQKANNLTPEQKEAIELFLRELLAALSRAANWSSEDRRQFRRDLALYAEFRMRMEKNAGNRKPSKAQEEESPFIARVALLLDPSMLDQARGAARKFHGGIADLTKKLLRQTLG